MSSIHQERFERLRAATMAEGIDGVLVVGNSWQIDYLRWAADYSVLEGDAIAIVLADGETHIFVEGPVEATRARVACPDAEIEECSNLTADVLPQTAKKLARAIALHKRIEFRRRGA